MIYVTNISFRKKVILFKLKYNRIKPIEIPTTDNVPLVSTHTQTQQIYRFYIIYFFQPNSFAKRLLV